uniref:Adenylyltransferase and sulfurtransferase MOCS3 n=1 Tax=Oryza glumipatula TaxID=40148 RepID=A0A0D9YZT7_9ORYZ
MEGGGDGDGGRSRAEAIMRELERLRAEREELDGRIRLLESQLRLGAAPLPPSAAAEAEPTGSPSSSSAAAADMISRYRRHLLLPQFGLEGQRKLSQSSILVVGAGGLGSPVAMYLAACGVGIVDGDRVELDNLHRQTIHIEAYVGQPKVKSAAASCRAINSSIKVFEYHITLNASNALDIMRQYDIVVDATNNLPSRYMISDCCVLMNKPLISGSAVGLEGQLTVYHHNGSPCYRCLYPNPPSSPTSQSCSDNGILGIRVIGCLQALEAIKVATAVGKPLCGRMLHFDALSSHTRIVKISRSSPTCKVCGENPVFTKEDFVNFDYESFTQSPMSKNSTTRSLNLLPENARVSCRDYKKVLDSGRPHLLVDVRPSHHFQIASMAHSINVPLSLLEEKLPLLRDSAREVSSRRDGRQHCPVYVICRRGNDSQVAVQILRENGFLYASDVAGGFESWAKEVDPSFLLY